MKKTYQLTDLDCAQCALKMEDAIRKIDGVTNASVNYIMQKLTIEAPDDRFEAVLQAAIKACRRVEPDCRVVL